jgi:hypothetical protein
MASLLTLSSAAAHAEAPTSQFGFSGWPYRQSVCEETNSPAVPTTAATPFPTNSPDDPYRLTEEEQDIMDSLVRSFCASERLQRHMQCLLIHG